MRRNTALLAFLLLGSLAASAATLVQPTTTLALESGNNTSASNSFSGQPNGNLRSGNVSKLPIRSLLYPGSETRIFAHVVPWWGKNDHPDVGYSLQDGAQVTREVEDMTSRGIDGAVVDWYGPHSFEDTSTKLFMQQAEEHSPFKIIVEIEHGAVVWDSCYPACSATTAVIQLATTASNTFFSSPAYERSNGRPVLMEFGMEVVGQAIDWAQVQRDVPGNPIWIHRNTPGFTTAASSGAFAWLDNQTVSDYRPGWNGTAYLNDFYHVSQNYPSLQSYGSVYKGFDDTIASWAPPGGRHNDQVCGQTWLQTFATLNGYYSSSKPLAALQLVTWNDYEEGTEIQTGIDNCLTVSGAVTNGTLNWTIAGQENTVDHYTVFISTDGQSLMPLGDFPTGSRALVLSNFDFAPGAYRLYVKAVGKPSLVNQISRAIAYTVAAPSNNVGTVIPTPIITPIAPTVPPVSGIVTPAGSFALNIARGTTRLARGKSALIKVDMSAISAFSGEVTLSCSNLPAGLSCATAKAQVKAAGSLVSTTLTITANPVQQSSNGHGGSGALLAFSLPGLGLVGVVFTDASRRRKLLFTSLAILVVLASLAGCGGAAQAPPVSINNGNIAASMQAAVVGTYDITVVATAGMTQQSTTATIAVE